MTAEAKAIELAFGHTKMLEDTHVSIFSDSLSCLQSLHNMNIDHPYILDSCSITLAAAVAQWVGPFALQSEGWVFESQPRQTYVVKQVVTAPLPNAWRKV